MTARTVRLAIDVACVLTLAALGLMLWSIFDPRPIPVIIAMSVGQGIGTLAFAIYLFVLIAALRKARVLDQHVGEHDEP
jgi:hypothetical protein